MAGNRHCNKPDLVPRFVEEAKIGGQLQHPGIVSVYELGAFADRRPYFTMKLVKGRTLASLLAERESPAHDLPRFLSIFQSICQDEGVEWITDHPSADADVKQLRQEAANLLGRTSPGVLGPASEPTSATRRAR